LNKQANKFMGQIISKGFKSPSILREGFRMGKFRGINEKTYGFLYEDY